VVDVTSEAGGQLSETDREAVRAMLPEHATVADMDSVLAVLDQKRSLTDEEDIDVSVILACTVSHKSRDLCFHVFLMEARVKTFVTNCTLEIKSHVTL